MNSSDCGTRMHRRAFLGNAGVSLGAMALGRLLVGGDTDAQAATIPAVQVAGWPHVPPRAKRVIFLTQSGGPSQLELFDDKPQHSGDSIMRGTLPA